MVDGPPDALEVILAWARTGPRGARVADVQVTEVRESFEEFELRPTE
jgi:acylphosphatase